MKTVEISNRALNQGKRDYGLNFLDFKDLFGRSQNIRHPYGNRRSGDYVFHVVNDVVCSVKKYVSVDRTWRPKCSVCDDAKKVLVYDLCDICDGVGGVSNGYDMLKCGHCDGGESVKYIPCQQCSHKSGINFT